MQFEILSIQAMPSFLYENSIRMNFGTKQTVLKKRKGTPTRYCAVFLTINFVRAARKPKRIQDDEFFLIKTVLDNHKHIIYLKGTEIK